MKEQIIFDADDFQTDYQKNGLNTLFFWKSLYPQFKATLFTIHGKTNTDFLKLIKSCSDWLQIGVHGFHHSSNFECQYWTEELTNDYLDIVEQSGYYQKVFRAPGWQITYPQPYNEKPNPSKPVNSDPQLIYKVLQKRGYIVADQHYNLDKRPLGLKVYCTCHPWQVHGHSWNMESGEPNGLEQIEKSGVPWNNNTKFYFISEAWDQGLIKPCQ